jgi:hypothetical protein
MNNSPPKTLIARWQSYSGEAWFELYRDLYGYSYSCDYAPATMRMRRSHTEETAIRSSERIIRKAYNHKLLRKDLGSGILTPIERK